MLGVWPRLCASTNKKSRAFRPPQWRKQEVNRINQSKNARDINSSTAVKMTAKKNQKRSASAKHCLRPSDRLKSSQQRMIAGYHFIHAHRRQARIIHKRKTGWIVTHHNANANRTRQGGRAASRLIERPRLVEFRCPMKTNRHIRLMATVQ